MSNTTFKTSLDEIMEATLKIFEISIRSLGAVLTYDKKSAAPSQTKLAGNSASLLLTNNNKRDGKNTSTPQNLLNNQ